MQNNSSVKVGDKVTIEGEPKTYTVTSVDTGPSNLTADEKEEMKRYWNWMYENINIEAVIHSWIEVPKGEDNA